MSVQRSNNTTCGKRTHIALIGPVSDADVWYNTREWPAWVNARIWEENRQIAEMARRCQLSLRWRVWQAALGTAPDDVRWAYSIMNSILANRLALTPFLMRIDQACKSAFLFFRFLREPTRRQAEGSPWL